MVPHVDSIKLPVFDTSSLNEDIFNTREFVLDLSQRYKILAVKERGDDDVFLYTLALAGPNTREVWFKFFSCDMDVPIDFGYVGTVNVKHCGYIYARHLFRVESPTLINQLKQERKQAKAGYERLV